MITFETEEDFQNAVLEAIMNKIDICVRTRGDHFVSRVDVAITNKLGEILLEDCDSCS